MDFFYDDQNIFAKILRGEIPNKTVFENNHALAFEDIEPQAAFHVLIIPKGPYVSMDDFAANASQAEQVGFFSAVAEITKSPAIKDGFRAITNTRAHGHQDVPHFHLHVLGGRSLGPMLSVPKA